MVEFDGLRAKLYYEALQEYPYARSQDMEIMRQYLNPQDGQNILGLGEGNGFFVHSIARAIGSSGNYLVTDPSHDQLSYLKQNYLPPSVQTKNIGAEELSEVNQYDKVWSFGAFHHCFNQELAMKKVYRALRKNGELVLCDVWRGTALSEHFDGPVTEYCCTGHEAKFLGDTYAKTICGISGFKEIQIEPLDLKWKFSTKHDIGKFIYKLHAMTRIEGNEQERINTVLEGCENILGVEKRSDEYILNWPMKVLTARKLVS